MKKGQITVFIILGVILLFIIGTVLYFTSEGITTQYEEAELRLSEIPREAQPVRDTVHAALAQLGKDGLRKIGSTGGYIEPAGSVNTFAPTDGNAVQLSPGGPQVSYWWHMSSKNTCKNNCQFASQRPTLQIIQEQLSDYITANLPSALDNLNIPGCTITAVGDAEATATLAANVLITATYPLQAACEGSTTTISDYAIILPLNFPEIYELATNITTYQADYGFLEQATRTILDSFSDVDNSLLPPTGGLEIGPLIPSKIWIKYNTKEELKKLITSYVPFIQVDGTRNYRYLTAPSDTRDKELYEALYNRQFLLPVDKDYFDLEARFVYLNWEPYFDLNCNGQVCQADSANIIFPPLLFTLNRYNFAYDISYPVMVELRAPNAFNGEGYNFHFMLEQNLRNSQPFKGQEQLYLPIDPEHAATNFCDPAQRTSGTIDMNVVDKTTGQPVNDASISYLCGGEHCVIGSTSNGTYSGTFPKCIGGVLKISKIDYATFSGPMDVVDDKSSSAHIALEKQKTISATIKNYHLVKLTKRGQWQFQEGMALKPDAEQTTIIQLTKNTTSWEEPFFTAVQLTGDTPAELIIAPGTYDVTINAFLHKDLVIPTDKRCTTYKKFFKKEKKCYDVPKDPIIFNATNPFPYGYAQFTWTVTPSDLLKNNVEFKQFILAIDKVEQNNRIVEDLEQIEKIRLYSAANQDKLTPVMT